MMDSDRTAPITLLRRSTTGGLGWPLILAITITITGLVAIGITVHCYKKIYGLSWISCAKTDDDSSVSVDRVSVQTT